jgi:glucose/arabinose dehydrogenase
MHAPAKSLVAALLLVTACSDDASSTGGGGGGAGGAPTGSGAGGLGGAEGGSGGAGGAGGEPGTTQTEPGPLVVEVLAESLDQPIFAVADAADPSRLYVVQKTGIVSVIRDGVLLDAPFVDVSGIIDVPGVMQERGLLSMALRPDFADSGRFFLFFSDEEAHLVLAEFERTSDPDVADPTPLRTLLDFPIEPGNHIAGASAFGPDGSLYVSIGDGTSAQDLGSKFGKILRVDVDTYPTPPEGNLVGEGVDPDVFHVGFHNPWRFSFDPQTGDLFIADVGLTPAWEEVNHLPVGAPSTNFGYPVVSGDECAEPGCDTTPFASPLYAYAHTEERCAIMGGTLYRGSRLEWLDGRFVFADLCSGELLSVGSDAVPTSLAPDWLPLEALPEQIVGVFSDARGELVVVGLGGRVVRVLPAPPMQR